MHKNNRKTLKLPLHYEVEKSWLVCEAGSHEITQASQGNGSKTIAERCSFPLAKKHHPASWQNHPR